MMIAHEPAQGVNAVQPPRFKMLPERFSQGMVGGRIRVRLLTPGCKSRHHHEQRFAYVELGLLLALPFGLRRPGTLRDARRRAEENAKTAQ
jgi:hypothetical protein